MKKLYIRAIILGFCLSVVGQVKAQVPLKPARVYVEGGQLFVAKRNKDGFLDQAKPYIIKGVTWSPATRAPDFGPNPLRPNENVEYGFFFNWPGRVPQGHVVFDYWMRSQFIKHYSFDLMLLEEMNANTIRVYSSFGQDPQVYKKILDECYRRNIMVIMTAVISKKDIDSKHYLRVVQICKDHPAILAWSLGNEWNLDYNKYWGYGSVASAARATNKVAAQIKKIDPNHPVSSCLGDRFSDPDTTNTISWIVDTCKDVDVWGLNIYRGQELGDLFVQWAKVSTKPFYISEFGTDSFDTQDFTIVNGFQADNCKGSQNQEQQAEFILNLWSQIQEHLSATRPGEQCLGGLVHEFNDSLWKVGSYHVSLGGLIDYQSHEVDSYNRYNSEGFYLPGAHPDNVANEEYFGVVDADRNLKKVFWQLQRAWK